MTSVQSTSPGPEAGRPRRWRVLRWSLGILGVLLMIPLILVWWTFQDGSLPRTLRLAQRLLPDGQLLFTDAGGSIARGGRIGQLQWRSGDMELSIEDLRLAWSLYPASRSVYVHVLAASSVRLHLARQPEDTDKPPFEMPDELSLPLRMRLPLAVGRLQIEMADPEGAVTTHLIEDVAAGYAYDGNQHAMRIARLRYGESTLQARLRMHARELTVSAELQAALRNLAPGQPFAMQAEVWIDGSLAGGEAASLALQASAVETGELEGNRTAVQAQATAHPWRTQPVEQLDLRISGLNTRDFHESAPVTALEGSASVQPVAGTGGQDVRVDLANGESGSWDRQRMPLSTVVARARLTTESLDIDLVAATMAGAAAEGRMALAGEIPLRQVSQSTLRLTLQAIDLQPWMEGLPRTALDGEVTMRPGPLNESWQLRAEVGNSVAGPLDRDRLPMEKLLATGFITADYWRVENLQLQVGRGQAQFQGRYEPREQVLDLSGAIRRLPLRRIHTQLGSSADAALSGRLQARGNVARSVDFDAELGSDVLGTGDADRQRDIRTLQARGRWSPARLNLERVQVEAFGARIDGSDIEVTLPELDAVSARVSANAPGIVLEADAAMRQRSGGGRMSLELASAGELAQWLRGLPVLGEQLPELQAAGSASMQAEWEGGWRQWREGLRRPTAYPQLHADAHLVASSLRIRLPPDESGQSLRSFGMDDLQVQLQGNLAAARFVADGDMRINDSRALVGADIQMAQRPGPAGAPRWTLTIDELAASLALPEEQEPWKFEVAEGLQATLQTGTNLSLDTTEGRATLTPPRHVASAGEALEVIWQPLQWSRGSDGATRLQSSGKVQGLHLGWLDGLLAPLGSAPLGNAGLYTDLVLRGEWDVRMTDQLDVQARLSRVSGDLWLGQPAAQSADGSPAVGDAVQALLQTQSEGVAAQIRTLDVVVKSDNDQIGLNVDWDTGRAGVIEVRAGTALTRRGNGWNLPEDAPLTGTVKARLQDLGVWGFLAPPGWRVQGMLDANVGLEGTLHSPQARGGIEASGLRIRSVLDGVDLQDGVLRAALEGSRLQITELTMQGGTGSRANVRGMGGNRSSPPREPGRMTASGTIDWSGVGAPGTTGSGILMDVQANLDRMQVLVRNDRQLSLGGELSASLDGGRLRVRGDLTVIRAAIMLPDARAPTLGDDVVVVRSSSPEDALARGRLQTANPMDLQIRLDLGRDLALQGHGITTRLEGELTVSTATGGSDPFRIVGEVRTVEGRFRAWNQALNVETGVILFNGPYSNPSLNLLAIRPEIEVRAGVRVTGTLEAPRLTLFSEPEMSEAEKLSWVVLGRAAPTSGTEGASMQQAALTLLAGGLGGSLAGDLGLDQLAVSDSSVSIGKRLSNELYVTYEAGLAGAASTLFVFYDITRRLTLRGQTSEASALDLIFTITYD